MKDIENKIMNMESITKEEAKKYMEYFTNETKDKIDINSYEKIDEINAGYLTKCLETNRYIYLNWPNNYYREINISNLINENFVHYSGIVTLNIEDKLVSYLIDLTYPQFLVNKYLIHNEGYVSIPNAINSRNLKVKELRERFSYILKENGYVEVDDDLIKVYLDIFIDAFNNREYFDVYYKVDKNVVYNKLFGENIKIK